MLEEGEGLTGSICMCVCTSRLNCDTCLRSKLVPSLCTQGRDMLFEGGRTDGWLGCFRHTPSSKLSGSSSVSSPGSNWTIGQWLADK